MARHSSAPPVNHEAIRARVGASSEITETGETTIACSGDGGALGHPKVFYTPNADGYAECGYCDRVFIFVSSSG